MNILLFTSKFGMGHYYAAEAIKEQIEHARPQDNVFLIDFMDILLGPGADRIYTAYGSLISRGSSIYNHVYKHCTELDRTVEKSRLGLCSALLLPVRRAIEKYQADLVISTYSGCNKYIGKCLRQYRLPIPFITCITDIGIHGRWVNPHVDLYLTASEETRRDLIKIGVDSHKIAVTGIPVRSAFSFHAAADSESSTKSGISSFKRNNRLLIMGGGLGLLPEEKCFYDALEKEPNLCTTVITGKNKELLRSFAGSYQHVEFLPFTDNIASYIKRSDWLLTKPGGITLFEAISAGTPLILTKPFLQQETANSLFASRYQISVQLQKNIVSSLPCILSVVADKEKQLQLSENMKALRGSLSESALLLFLCRFETVLQKRQKARRECV